MPSPALSLSMVACVAIVTSSGCVAGHASHVMRQAAEAHERGDATLAATGYRDALRLEPGVRGAYQNLAVLAAQADRLSDALTLAHMEIARHPEASPPRLNAAALLLRAGRPGDALGVLAPLEHGVAVGLRIGAHHLSAQMALDASALPSALQALDAAIALAGARPGLLLDRALLLAHMGEQAQASEVIDSVLAAEPGHRRAQSLQAHLAP